MPPMWTFMSVLVAWVLTVFWLWKWRNRAPDAPDSYEQTVFRRRTGFWIWSVASAGLAFEVLRWVSLD